MLPIKRKPGRPPKVRPEALPEPVLQEEPFIKAVLPPEELDRRTYVAPEATSGERTVEVEVIRKYAPYGQETEIKKVVYPGTVMRLGVVEATRALQLGIARGTPNTFKG